MSEEKPYKPAGFYSNMTNEQLISYVRTNYSGKSTVEFKSLNGRSYVEVRKRDLLGKLVELKILTSKRSDQKRGSPTRLLEDLAGAGGRK